jgi:hypothetical protein
MNESPKMAELRQISRDLAGMPAGTDRVLAQRRREELMAMLIRGGFPEDMVHSAAEVASGDHAAVEALIPTAAHDLAVDMAAWVAAEAPRTAYNVALYFDYASCDFRDLVPTAIFGDPRKLAYVEAQGGDVEAARYDPWNPAPKHWAPTSEAWQPATHMFPGMADELTRKSVGKTLMKLYDEMRRLDLPEDLLDLYAVTLSRELTPLLRVFIDGDHTPFVAYPWMWDSDNAALLQESIKP